MKKLINPILNKELKIGARTVKFPIAVAVYTAVMSIIGIAILASTAAKIAIPIIDITAV